MKYEILTNILLYTLVLCVLFVQKAKNARILCILPLPLPSHFSMYKVIFKELAARGHDVSVVTSFPTERNETGLRYTVVDRLPFYNKPLTIQFLRSLSVQGNLDLMFNGPNKTDSRNLCQYLFEPEEMKKLRDNKENYDLLIIEVFIADCLFGFAHIFNAPVVAVTSSVDLPWGTSRIGNPDNPAYIPTYFRDILPDMSLYERILNTITLLHTKLAHKYYMLVQDREARKFFGKDLPPIQDIVSNTSLFILNSHFSMNQARPNVPNVVEAAGIHIKMPRKLDENLQKFLGNSKFIYFSLGSLFPSEVLPIKSLESICAVFRKLEYKVVWKVDKQKLPPNLTLSGNIYAEKWVNQIDILCHSNILFFMTHNGLLGTQEAIYCGIPMLSTPLFADQYLNMKNMVQKGIAVEIDLETVTEDKLSSAIEKLIHDKSFKNNAKKISDQFRDRPNTPLEEVVYWIEYVLKYRGAPQLRSRGAGIAWYQYYLVDVILITILLVAVCLLLIILLISRIFKVFHSNRLKIKDS